MARVRFVKKLGLLGIFSLLLTAGCRSGLDLEIRPYGQKRTEVVAESASASVLGYVVERDLQNVEGKKPTYPPELLQVLASNGCLITESESKEFYQAYLENPRPFVTSDSIAHAYHTLLNDTLVAAQTGSLQPRLNRLLKSSQSRMLELWREAPEPEKASAEVALIYLTLAARTAGLEAYVPEELSPQVAELVDIPIEPTATETPDPFQKLNLRFAREALSSKQFRSAWRYLSTKQLPCSSDEELRACVFLSRAVAESGNWNDYLVLRRLTLSLGGEPEDLGPEAILQTLSANFKEPEWSKAEALKAVRSKIGSLRKPKILDHPGEEPQIGLRLLPPSVTLKAELFDDLLDPSSDPGTKPAAPTGMYIVNLLGGTVERLPRGELVNHHREKVENSQGLHARALWAISALNLPAGDGYPPFMNSPLWAFKTQNTQLAAWAELEHAYDLLVKDNASYLGGYFNEVEFHGYVEPRPEFFERLASLVAETREVFEQSGLFPELEQYHRARIRELEEYFEERREELTEGMNLKRGSVWELSSRPDTARKMHYDRLERLCLILAEMSRKELSNRPFSKAEIRVLETYGDELKFLSLNTTNISEPPKPSGTVVEIWTDSGNVHRNYVATGRPLALDVIVPYGGKLYWSVGAVSSYYEFSESTQKPVWDDRSWKQQVEEPLAEQPHQPWLAGKNALQSP